MKINGYLVLKWDEYYNDILSLAQKILKSNFRPDILITIARGGWVIGRILSDLLSIDEVASIGLRLYKDIGKVGEKPIMKQSLNVSVNDLNVLLVDDVSDTGTTLNVAEKYVLSMGARVVKTATLYLKPWSKHKPDFFIKITSRWVVFPYELNEAILSIARELILERRLSNKEVKQYLLEIGFEHKIIEHLLPEVFEKISKKARY